MAILRQWFDEKRDKEKRDNIEAFLCQSTTFARSRIRTVEEGAGSTAVDFESRQASAKLHVHYGTPIFCPRRTKYSQAYSYAISMVYDLRNYTEETLWGPYLADGQASVDWEKMEAVMIVLGWNLRVFMEQSSGGGVFGPRSIWREPWVGASPGSYEAGKCGLPQALPEGVVDYYGIQGTWLRVVCFLGISPFFTPALGMGGD
jgi:hypothetical protein